MVIQALRGTQAGISRTGDASARGEKSHVPLSKLNRELVGILPCPDAPRPYLGMLAVAPGCTGHCCKRIVNTGSVLDRFIG